MKTHIRLLIMFIALLAATTFAGTIDLSNATINGYLPLLNIQQGGATTNQLMGWNGTTWAPMSYSTSLLSDVNLNNLAVNDIMVWNGSNWINQVPSDVRTSLGLGTAAVKDVGTDEYQLLTWAANINANPITSAVGATELGAIKRGTLPIAAGGTGQTTRQAAIDALTTDEVADENKVWTLKWDGFARNGQWEVPTVEWANVFVNNFDIGLNLLSNTGALDGQVMAYNTTLSTWEPQTISTGLTINSTLISGASNGDILIGDGTKLQKLTPGTGVSTWLATPTIANLNTALGATLATTGANTFAAAQTINAASGNPLVVQRSSSTFLALNSTGHLRLGSTGDDGLTLVSQYGNTDVYAGGSNNWVFDRLSGTNFGSFAISNGGAAVRLYTESEGVLQLGADSASTTTAQTIKAHDVTTGTGASLTLAGGTGSAAGGALILATSATSGAPATRLSIASTGMISLPTSGAASTPALAATGSIFTGGSGTTTKPLVMIEPSGTTSTGWVTTGTALGINTAAASTADGLGIYIDGSRKFRTYYEAPYYYMGIYSPAGVEISLTNLYNQLVVGAHSTCNNVTLWSTASAGAGAFIASSSNGGVQYFALAHTGVAGQLQIGATTPSTTVDQLIKAHDVTTGTGAKLTLAGGAGSTAGGAVELSTSTTNGAPVARVSVAASGTVTLPTAGAASAPPLAITGTWFSGGSSKPQLLVEPTGTTSTGWSTSGTGIGINAPSGFVGNLIDLRVNNSQTVWASSTGNLSALNFTSTNNMQSSNYIITSPIGAVTWGGETQIIKYGTTAWTFGADQNIANPSDAIIKGGSGITGTDRNGADFIIEAGNSTGTGTAGVIFKTPTAGSTGTTANVASEKMRITGSGIKIGSGTSIAKIKHGTATLVAGAATVSDSDVASDSRILVNRQADGGTAGDSYSVSISAGASFTLTSMTAGAAQTADTSVVSWIMINP